jgi:hypothetical protein
MALRLSGLGRSTPPWSVEVAASVTQRYARDAKDRAYRCNSAQHCVHDGIGSIGGDQTSSPGAC